MLNFPKPSSNYKKVLYIYLVTLIDKSLINFKSTIKNFNILNEIFDYQKLPVSLIAISTTDSWMWLSE